MIFSFFYHCETQTAEISSVISLNGKKTLTYSIELAI